MEEAGEAVLAAASVAICIAMRLWGPPGPTPGQRPGGAVLIGRDLAEAGAEGAQAEVVAPLLDLSDVVGERVLDRRHHVVAAQLLDAPKGRRGLVVKAAGWLSLDLQFEPYLRANLVAPSWCGPACDAVPEP